LSELALLVRTVIAFELIRLENNGLFIECPASNLRRGSVEAI